MGQMPVRKKRQCAVLRVDSEMYAAEGRENRYCDEITERDGQNFLTPFPLLFSTIPIQLNLLLVRFAVVDEWPRDNGRRICRG